jgi:hypothetical protein
MRVVSLKEVVAIVLFFAIILGLLHDKDVFKRLLLSERSNYDLTETYLRNLVRLSPHDAKLILEFTNVLIKQGKVDLADSTLSALESSQDIAVRDKALRLRFELLKRTYYTVEKEEAKQKIAKKMAGLLERMVAIGAIPPSQYRKWLPEAEVFGTPALQYKLLKKVAKNDPKDLKILKSAMTLALQHKDKSFAKWSADVFWKARPRWLTGLDDNAVRQNALLAASLYQVAGKYRLVADIYLWLYQRSGKLTDLEMAINQYLWNGRYQEGAKLAKQHESEFLKTKAGAKKLLDIYLQAGQTEEARRLGVILLDRFGALK